MITRTPQRNFYTSNAPSKKGYYIGNASSVVLLLTVKAGATAGFITFIGSAQDKEIDLNQPASQENHFSRIAVNDLDTGHVYEGSVGITVAQPKLMTLEMNVEELTQLAVDDSMSGGAEINIDIICTQK